MIMRVRFLPSLIVALLLVVGAVVGIAAAQQATPPQNPTPALRVSTRLVLVDVTVLDKNRQPVRGLSASDFTVLENKKPQPIASFSEQEPGRLGPAALNLPALPPNIYTNRPEYRMPAGAPTVILLDALNTPFRDQSYARMQLLRYVDTQLQPHQSIAVYTLGRALRLLQDFTDDPRLLRAAIASFSPEKSLELELGDVEKRLPPAPQLQGTLRRAAIQSVVARVRDFYFEQTMLALDERVADTMQAFRLIAQSLAGYAGRKNLIWVSGSFPATITRKIVHFGVTPSDPNYVSVERAYSDDLRQAASILTNAQVTVYPVDARGLFGSTLSDASSTNTDDLGFVRQGMEYSEAVAGSSTYLEETQETLRQLARDTGGRVFVNTNDLDHAVALSVAEGSSYYLLAYYPANERWDGKFRSIQVKVDRPGLEARSRTGYFAVPLGRVEKHEENLRDAELAEAMKVGAPLATTIVFDARVTPPPVSDRMKVRVEFLVDPSTLTYEAAKDGGRRYDLDFHAAAYTPEGKLAAHQDVHVVAPLKAAAAQSIEQQGFPFETELPLGPGKYQLRMAVRDNRTGFLGSVAGSLVREKNGAR